MGWYQRHIQEQAWQKEQERIKQQQAAENAAKAAKQAKAQQEQMDAWKNAYNTGGDQGLADYIIENGANTRNGASGFAKQVKAGNLTFKELGAQQEQERYEAWAKQTAGNETYGAQNQTLRQLMPWKSQEAQFGWAEGWVDPQIQIDKDKTEAERKRKKEAAAAEAKRKAELAEADRQKQLATQNAIKNKPKKPATPDPVQKPANQQKAQEYSDTYKETITNSSGSITNNIEQNVGNKGDWKTNLGNNNTVNNSEIGNDFSENQGSINVKNEIQTSTQPQQEKPLWDNDSFIRNLAKERADSYRKKVKENNNFNFQNNVDQNIGNSGNWNTTIGNNSTINNSKAGNDYSINLGNINTSNSSTFKPGQFSF